MDLLEVDTPLPLFTASAGKEWSRTLDALFSWYNEAEAQTRGNGSINEDIHDE